MKETNLFVFTTKRLLFFFLLSFSCLANKNVSLTLSGNVSIPEFIPPSAICEATFIGDGLIGYSWIVNGDARETPNGNRVTINFNGNEKPSTGSPVEVTVICRARYSEEPGLESVILSNPVTVKWVAPDISIDIEGEDEVLRDSTHIYSPEHHGELNSTGATYTWTWEDNGLVHTFAGDTCPLNFLGTSSSSITLNCKANVSGVEVTANPKSINVLDQNYLINVKRKDYSGIYIPSTQKMIHSNPYITDDRRIYVHFNVDDDESAEENDKNNCGWDYLQTTFEKDTIDDDLCELEISIIKADGAESLQGEKIRIEVPECLRLWKNQSRQEEDDLLLGGDNKSREWTLNSYGSNSEILGHPIFVEGVAYDSCGKITITVKNIQRKVEYATCSVGNKDSQPTKVVRKDRKKWFPKMVDCEWCVLRDMKSKSVSDYYNCIAFSVDPYLQTFKDLNFINGNFLRQIFLGIDKKYNGAFWVKKVNEIYTGEAASNTDDKFWISLKAYLSSEEFYIWCILLHNILRSGEHNLKINFARNGNLYFFHIRGNDTAFKEALPSFINTVADIRQKSIELKYFLAMHDFNSSANNNAYDIETDPNCFFTNDLWKNNNNGSKYEQCGLNSENRKIIFYDNFHAARRASTLKRTEYKPPKYVPNEWYIFASKCGAAEVILHLDNQIESDIYGNMKNAYK